MSSMRDLSTKTKLPPNFASGKLTYWEVNSLLDFRWIRKSVPMIQRNRMHFAIHRNSKWQSPNGFHLFRNSLGNHRLCVKLFIFIFGLFTFQNTEYRSICNVHTLEASRHSLCKMTKRFLFRLSHAFHGLIASECCLYWINAACFLHHSQFCNHFFFVACILNKSPIDRKWRAFLLTVEWSISQWVGWSICEVEIMRKESRSDFKLHFVFCLNLAMIERRCIAFYVVILINEQTVTLRLCGQIHNLTNEKCAGECTEWWRYAHVLEFDVTSWAVIRHNGSRS